MTSTASFKTNAWKEKASADRYHESTAAAAESFQIVRHELFIKHLRSFTTPGQKILDLGCGSGLVAMALHDLGYKVVACDVSESMLQRFSEEMGARAIELRQGDGFTIPAGDGEFDVVVSRMFIQHFPDWQAILREKARVTRRGGIIFYDFANLEHLALAPGAARGGSGFPYSIEASNPERFYAACSEKELRATARELGMTVVELIPCGLFVANAQLAEACGPQGVAVFDERLNERLRDSAVRDFYVFLEEEFVRKLPKHICYGNFTVLRNGMEASASPLGI
jgi:ubiquinone/menaquinone biosynthesis C-methylase UbiE